MAFWLGLRHAPEPDHLAAVSTMATSARSQGTASRVGVLWGLGHSTTVVAFGAVLLVLQRAVPSDVARVLDGAAGVTLLVLAWVAVRTAGSARGANPGGADTSRGTLGTTARGRGRRLPAGFQRRNDARHGRVGVGPHACGRRVRLSSAVLSAGVGLLLLADVVRG